MLSAELQIQPKGAGLGVCKENVPVRGVDLPQRFGHQHLDMLADQLVAVITEQRLSLPVDKPDHTLLVHPHQSIRHRLQQLLELRRLRYHLVPLRAATEGSKLATRTRPYPSNSRRNRFPRTR